MAGHSKWANIKHRKARQDAKKGKEWSRCAKAIILAARDGGGDPDANLTLRYAIDDAKAVNMPKDTIEKAIKKGTGELAGGDLETIVYEGYAPGGVAIMVEAVTDNRNRTASEVRHVFDKYGGNLGSSGSVAFVFTARGIILLPKSVGDEEQVMELALEAGAEDVSDEDDFWQLTTEPGNLNDVREALIAQGIEIESASISMIPSNTVACEGDDAKKVLNLIESLDEIDDVQNIHANFDIPDDQLAALQS